MVWVVLVKCRNNGCAKCVLVDVYKHGCAKCVLELTLAL